MTKKTTKREMFAQLMEKYPLTAEEKAFCEHEIELLEKKKSGERKPTATQIANEALKAEILRVLEEAETPMTVSEIAKAHATAYGVEAYSTQKLSPILSKLTDELKVVKTVEKRKSYFAIAE